MLKPDGVFVDNERDVRSEGVVELKDAAVRRWILLVALTGLLSALVVPAASAATLSLSPGSGRVGTALTISGSGFSPNAKVTIYWDAVVLVPEFKAVDGSFVKIATVPAGPLGAHTVLADGPGQGDASKVFTVTAPPTTTTKPPTTTTTTTTTKPPTTTTTTKAPTTTSTTTSAAPTTTGAASSTTVPSASSTITPIESSTTVVAAAALPLGEAPGAEPPDGGGDGGPARELGDGGPILSLDRASAGGGDSVVVTVEGLQPGSGPYQLLLDGQPVSTGRIAPDDVGRANVELLLPAGVAAGVHTVGLVDEASGDVVATAELTIEPVSARPWWPYALAGAVVALLALLWVVARRRRSAGAADDEPQEDQVESVADDGAAIAAASTRIEAHPTPEPAATDDEATSTDSEDAAEVAASTSPDTLEEPEAPWAAITRRIREPMLSFDPAPPIPAPPPLDEPELMDVAAPLDRAAESSDGLVGSD